MQGRQNIFNSKGTNNREQSEQNFLTVVRKIVT